MGDDAQYARLYDQGEQWKHQSASPFTCLTPNLNTQAEDSLNQEVLRVSNYLNAVTEPKLIVGIELCLHISAVFTCFNPDAESLHH